MVHDSLSDERNDGLARSRLGGVRVGDLVERIRRGDGGAELAGRGEVGKGGLAKPISLDEQPGHTDAALCRVIRDRQHSGGQGRNEDSAGLENFQSLGGVIAADHLQDDIDVGDDLSEICSGVINHLIGAK